MTSRVGGRWSGFERGKRLRFYAPKKGKTRPPKKEDSRPRTGRALRTAGRLIIFKGTSIRRI